MVALPDLGSFEEDVVTSDWLKVKTGLYDRQTEMGWDRGWGKTDGGMRESNGNEQRLMRRMRVVLQKMNSVRSIRHMSESELVLFV